MDLTGALALVVHGLAWPGYCCVGLLGDVALRMTLKIVLRDWGMSFHVHTCHRLAADYQPIDVSFDNFGVL